MILCWVEAIARQLNKGCNWENQPGHLPCQDRLSCNEQLVRSKEAIEAQTRTMTRICIVAHFSYGAITGGKRDTSAASSAKPA